MAGFHFAQGITAAASVVTSLGVLAAAAAARWAGHQVQEAQRSRSVATAITISQRWESQEVEEARRATVGINSQDLVEIALTARRENSDEYFLYMKELNFFEDLAVMEKLGGVSLEWIKETLRTVTIKRWEYWKPAVLALRKDTASPAACKNFQDLAEKLAHDG
jgi:hypothetical protein